MIGGWVEVDGVPEGDLPEWARRDDGDRVVLGEHGVACVSGGRGSVARWGEVLGVAEAEGDAYVLVPRRPPHPPWFQVTHGMLPEELRDDGIGGFVAAVDARRGQAGYREAQTVRRPVALDELERRIRAREEIPGAVEVPARGRVAPWTPAKGAVALAVLFFGVFVCPLSAAFAMIPLMGAGGDESPAFVCVLYAAIFAGIGAAVFLVKRIWKRMDAKQLAHVPAPRMLVMTPDGCMLALEGGARALAWSEIGRFDWSGDPDSQRKAGRSWLVVDAPDGGSLGTIDGAWFDAPLPLIVAVANAYRARA